jgi:hypothetical protein
MEQLTYVSLLVRLKKYLTSLLDKIDSSKDIVFAATHILYNAELSLLCIKRVS